MTRTLTTAATLTPDQIRALRAEAARAGDRGMIKVCDKALMGIPSACFEVAGVIRENEARVMDDEARGY